MNTRPAEYEGFCTVCGRWVFFRDMASPIRETYQCMECRASMRERVTASAIISAYGNGQIISLAELALKDSFAKLNIFEPGVSGAFRPFLSTIANYHNSFYWEGLAPGALKDGVRNEDLTRLSFSDGEFDLVITSDIFEHIRKPWDGFAEVRRVLRPGGYHIFSIPILLPMPKKTVERVDTTGPEDQFTLEQVYHGDGRGGRSLVYTDFGADIFEKLFDHGFKTFIVKDDHVDKERMRVIALISQAT